LHFLKNNRNIWQLEGMGAKIVEPTIEKLLAYPGEYLFLM